MQIRKFIKPLIICATLLVIILSVYIEPLNKKNEYIYTHFFYLPVILTAYWYHFHFLWVAVFIALLFFFSASPAEGYFQLHEYLVNPVFFSIAAMLVIFLKKKYSDSGKETEEREYKSQPCEIDNSDISKEELKKLIAEKEQHLREVYHRIKNNMQVVTSLISLQIVKEKEEIIKNALLECQNRVKTMSIIQEKIYSSVSDNYIDFKEIVESMSSYLLRAYKVDKNKIDLSINIPQIKIDVNTAIPLSQIVNEILSNSLKHAFTGEISGRVEIKLQQHEYDTSSFSLRICDNGVGLPDLSFFPDKGKLGFHLINALARQMGGRIELDLTSGTSFKFIFTLK